MSAPLSAFDASVVAALDRVYDPCSVAAGRPTGLHAMGLVLGWELREGVLCVDFCATFTGCTLAPHFMSAAQAALAELPGVARVVTRMDSGFLWTPDRMRAAPKLRAPAVTPWALRQPSA